MLQTDKYFTFIDIIPFGWVTISFSSLLWFIAVTRMLEEEKMMHKKQKWNVINKCFIFEYGENEKEHFLSWKKIIKDSLHKLWPLNEYLFIFIYLLGVSFINMPNNCYYGTHNQWSALIHAQFSTSWIALNLLKFKSTKYEA